MAFVDIHPHYRQTLARQGLATAAEFLALPGVVCCGHPDRHVARVTLGTGSEAFGAFLKREHRIHWRDRLASAWAGFGFVSRSSREFALLRKLEKTAIGSPRAIAAGEDDEGRAFLLVCEFVGGVDLRQALRPREPAPRWAPHHIARELGVALARLHDAGFEHPDLYSKHILVGSGALAPKPAFTILDWQRVRRRRHVSWTRRWRDLAALDATLADNLATPRQRLRALFAYLQVCRPCQRLRAGLTLGAAARAIRRRALRLLERRRIREMRQPPLTVGTQNLIWLDGEALQVTREFRDELGGQMPPWLNAKKVSGTLSVRTMPLPGARLAHFVTRSASRPWRFLWAWLRRQPLVAPELESMNVLFRLQRYGVVLPRLLAAGQQNVKLWQTQSFLLTEPLQEAMPLPQFLQSAPPATCRQVIGQAAGALRQMHRATCYVENAKYDEISGLLSVFRHANGGHAVALATVHGIEKCPHPNPVRAQRDLAALAQALGHTCSRTDLLRGLLAYFGQARLTFVSKRFARRVLKRLARPGSRRRIST